MSINFELNFQTLSIATVWILYWMSIWNVAQIAIEHAFPIVTHKKLQVIMYFLCIIVFGSLILGSNAISGNSDKSNKGH
jgi:hypothetical protein